MAFYLSHNYMDFILKCLMNPPKGFVKHFVIGEINNTELLVR